LKISINNGVYTVPTDNIVIDIEHVSKTYKRKIKALQDVSLQVKKGEFFGLLGPNGAGKSTLVKILTTIVRASQCKGTMLGHNIGHMASLERVGYLPEHASFPNYLTGEQVLDYCGGMLKVPKAIRIKRIDELLKLVGMDADRKRRMKTYSKGMKQRIGVAQALINDPDLVFLDEPTDGVDPKGRKEIRDVLVRMKNEGKTVFVNSHLLSELELVSDSVAILNKGVVVKKGSLKELTQYKGFYEICLAGHLPKDKNLLEILVKNNASYRFETSVSFLKIPKIDPKAIQPIIDALRSNKQQIDWVKPSHQSLEDLFMETVTEVTEDDLFEPVSLNMQKANGGES
jgi:ABC-2 type transport system ATP-binding protein